MALPHFSIRIGDSFVQSLSNTIPPVGTPGFKSRIRPPYPQRVVKGADTA